MVEIRNTDDLLRALREHPEWKAAVRGEILGEELLDLPRRVSELDERLTSRLDALTITLQGFMETTQQRFDEVDARFDEVETRLGKVETRLGKVETRLGSIDGIITEDQYRRTFASRVRDIEGGARITKVLSLQELNDLGDEAAASGFITPNESDQLAWTDVVALGRIKGSGEEVTFVAEISTTVRKEDISRAAERAEIASKAIPARRAIAVVMGRSAQGLRKAHCPGVWLIENQKATELVG